MASRLARELPYPGPIDQHGSKHAPASSGCPQTLCCAPSPASQALDRVSLAAVLIFFVLDCGGYHKGKRSLTCHQTQPPPTSRERACLTTGDRLPSATCQSFTSLTKASGSGREHCSFFLFFYYFPFCCCRAVYLPEVSRSVIPLNRRIAVTNGRQ